MSDYLLALEKLAQVRALHNGEESNEEDRLLDEMDDIWLRMTDEERVKMQKLKRD